MHQGNGLIPPQVANVNIHTNEIYSKRSYLSLFAGVVCPELANGTNMYVEVSEDRFVGSVARYFPNLGYYLEGPINTTCLQTEDVRNCEGFWFHPPPTAKRLFSRCT